MERNITLDYFKIILSIFVITIHFDLSVYDGSLPFVSEIGRFFTYGIAKIAVPCFFVINGYYLNLDNKQKFLKYIKRLTLIYVIWTFIYIPFLPIFITNFSTFLIIIFGGYFHLWYLIALIFAALTLFFFRKYKKNDRLLLIVAILLYAIGVIIQIYSNESTFSLYKYRNFLFTGFPFISIGYLLKKMNSSLARRNEFYLLLTSVIICIIEIIISNFYLNHKPLVSLVIACPILVLFIIKNGKTIQSHKNDISFLSSAIYFIHIWAIYITLENFQIANIYLFPFVIILSIFLSFIVIQANKNLKIFL